MTEFQKPFFKSESDDVELEYTLGVYALQNGDFNTANKKFYNAAHGGHVSAIYNMSLLWGGGYLTPYDFDVAAEYWYRAAAEGHPRAKELLWQLEAADRGGLGTNNLAKLISGSSSSNQLTPSVMICAARFYDVLCRKYGATVDVIAYELDAADASNFPFIQSFIERTGISSEFYAGGTEKLIPGSAADQITDGLNVFYLKMRDAGASNELALMARCSIVGHIIKKSPYGDKSKPLYGIDKFFTS